jgi:vancomycin permeability regulator SanA
VTDAARPTRGALLAFGLRVLAAWLGALTLLNVAAALRHPTFDQTVWLVDLRPFQHGLALAVSGLAALALLVWGIDPRRRGVRIAAAVAAAIFALAAILDVVGFYRAWGRGEIAPSVPAPLSVLTAGAFVAIAIAARRPWPRLGRRGRLVAIAGVSGALVLLVPLMQILFFGTTDYRRPAQAAVVLGARVMPDGEASVVLADRVRTGVELYRQGLVDTLVMSGGLEPDTGYDETAVMRSLAIEEGVPATEIVLDPGGTSTAATVTDTVRLFAERGVAAVLVVSHFYHLPRIKLAYERAGLEVYTVPAAQSAIVPQTPANVAREIPALWVYYLRAALS